MSKRPEKQTYQPRRISERMSDLAEANAIQSLESIDSHVQDRYPESRRKEIGGEREKKLNALKSDYDLADLEMIRPKKRRKKIDKGKMKSEELSQGIKEKVENQCIEGSAFVNNIRKGNSKRKGSKEQKSIRTDSMSIESLLDEFFE